ncbi:MAG: cell wall-binding repeat-containing protein [Clostridioides sp.]|jgi:putative cell wall-binding protein|nr:cell wall-binding repeat-containing protein [Clostridioides sp.]
MIKNFKKCLSFLVAILLAANISVISAFAEGEATITAPAGARVEFYKQNLDHNTVRTGEKTSDGSPVELDKNATYWRVSKQGELTHTGYIQKSENIVVDFSGDKTPESTENNTGSITQSRLENSMLLNINDKNHLKLAKVGDKYRLRTYRAAWEIIDSDVNNQIIYPDFHVNVVEGSDIIKVDQVEGRPNWFDVEGLKKGSAIVEVKYDAVKVYNKKAEEFYGASYANRTGVFVVTVGDTGEVDFDIQGPTNSGPGGDISWDSEFDTVYFKKGEGHGILDMKPKDATEVSVATVKNGQVSQWKNIEKTGDKYPVEIGDGSNIIKVVDKTGTDYSVVKGGEVELIVENLTSAGSNEINPGDQVKFSYKGLFIPMPKFAGTYNPHFTGVKLNYKYNGSEVSSKGKQYDFINNHDITVTAPDEPGRYSLKEGKITESAFTFNDLGKHREIGDDGYKGSGMAKVIAGDFSKMPDIDFEVKKYVWDGIRVSEPRLVGEQYQISKESEFKWFADKVTDGTIEHKDAKLVSDIDLGGHEWTPIGGFGMNSKIYNGTFDGNGKKITGLKLIAKKDSGVYKDSNLALFGAVGDATGGKIKNLTVEGEMAVDKSSKYLQRSGSTVGTLSGIGSLEDVVSKVDITIPENDYKVISTIGGVVGYMNSNDAVLKNIVNLGNIDLSKITNIAQEDPIFGSGPLPKDINSIGGILGYLGKGQVIGSYNRGNIIADTSKASRVGGIYGNSDVEAGNLAVVRDSYSASNISGGKNVGAIAGTAVSRNKFENVYYLENGNTPVGEKTTFDGIKGLSSDELKKASESIKDSFVDVPKSININDGYPVLDLKAPVIESVKSTPEEPNTASTVTLTVEAKDDTKIPPKVSFDGGKTWIDINSKEYKSSTTVASGQIQVKDLKGNIASYDKEIDIKVKEQSSGGGQGGGGSTGETEQPKDTVKTEELSGSDRYETSVKISQKAFEKAENVVIANSSSLADALSVAPFAKSVNAPVLLTDKNTVNARTIKEVQRLGAKKVYLIGGENSISTVVEKDLKSKGYETERINGSDRYDTSLKIAGKISSTTNLSQVVIVNGDRGLADAVSAGAVSASNKMPVILTNANDDMKDIKAFLSDRNIKKVYAIGGEKLFSKESANLPAIERIYGENRNETNRKVIEKFYTDKNLNNIYICKNGSVKTVDLIDSLSVGVLASKNEAPLMIVGNTLSTGQRELVKSKVFKTITKIGGNGNEKAYQEIVNLTK